MKPQKQILKRGLGLFSYEQVKNTRPFDHLASIIIGGILVSLGIMVGISQYHAPHRSSGWLLTSAVLIAIGIFDAHAGVIFWWRRLR